MQPPHLLKKHLKTRSASHGSNTSSSMFDVGIEIYGNRIYWNHKVPQPRHRLLNLWCYRATIENDLRIWRTPEPNEMRCSLLKNDWQTTTTCLGLRFPQDVFLVLYSTKSALVSEGFLLYVRVWVISFNIQYCSNTRSVQLLKSSLTVKSQAVTDDGTKSQCNWILCAICARIASVKPPVSNPLKLCWAITGGHSLLTLVLDAWWYVLAAK